MKLLDTDTINYILERDVNLGDNLSDNQYFVTPDVEQEMYIAEIVHDKKVPKNIKVINSRSDFDKVSYIKNYFMAINQYKKRSFFNMKGFGDVSIVACVKTLIEASVARPQRLPLPGFDDKIEVYTGDANLKKSLQEEFNGNIKVLAKSDIEYEI